MARPIAAEPQAGSVPRVAAALPAEERQTSFTQMMEIALDTAVKMAGM